LTAEAAVMPFAYPIKIFINKIRKIPCILNPEIKNISSYNPKTGLISRNLKFPVYHGNRKKLPKKILVLLKELCGYLIKCE